MEGTTRSVKRALEVLASICDRPDSSLSDVAAQTGMPLSTTHRILQTLMASGHLVRSSEGLYTAGPQ
ncbi:helix-turn-helix domain-containing protein, partial [Amycolatopsis sp. H6(2020)]|nr:helix-turn-helix domain-containing protein [Amycolatopsis sp. H6(2020)]